jgi:cytidylate kinase
LGFHLLDSGALYRVVGFAAHLQGVAWDNEAAVTEVARHLAVQFENRSDGVAAILSGRDITADIRSEFGGRGASVVAQLEGVREALLLRQREFAQYPGLVADGRDMGTVVFPEAPLKIFLTASAQARAERRFSQLKARGEDVSLARLLDAIIERDERDANRATAPLRAAADAVVIDSTALSIDEVVAKSLMLAHERHVA